MIRAILFDLDDTLLDRDATIELYVRNLYHRYDLDPLPYETFLYRFKALDKRGYAGKHELFQSLITEFALPAAVKELVVDFRRTAWKGCKRFLFPDAEGVLKQLRLWGYKLGLVTNGSVESQRTKLVESGLAPLADVALTSAEEGVKKPAPEIFIRAAARLGATVKECIFVGDDPEKDVGGAHRVGMRTIWVQRHKSWPRSLTVTPTHTVRALGELLTIELREKAPKANMPDSRSLDQT